MANENIKIIVQEDDQTRPRGSGVSSDIVYVPGLAHEFCPVQYRNKPLLCSTVDEFEAYFGSEPYKFSSDEAVSECVVKKGDYDKSYIYAKELINAGLSVLYENVAPEDGALENHAEFFVADTSKGITKVKGTQNVFRVTGDDVTSASLKFKLDAFTRNYGGVTVICKPDSASSINVGFTDLRGPSGFTINGSSITWENIDPKTAEFTVTISIQNGKDNLFCVSLVDGTDIAVPVDTYNSRLEHLYSNLIHCFKKLEDKNEYTVKYLTTGGYPSFNPIVNAEDNTTYPYAGYMLDCAASRNDAVALIDHWDDSEFDLTLKGTGTGDCIYKLVNDHFKNVANTEFGAMFTPWGDYNCVTVEDADATLQAMPASFGYLMCLAKAIKTSPNWLAMAGVSRGIVPNLQRLRTNKILSNVIAENYQPKYGDMAEENVISINAITNVKPYGLTIWGNRTLKRVASKGTVATNFLNTRNMISDIKKLSYNTAKSLMFEQESDTLWINFKSGVSPLLEQLKSGRGISDYKLIKNTTKYNGAALTRGEMSAIIKIFPLYAVEYFEITVVVSDNDVAVS